MSNLMMTIEMLDVKFKSGEGATYYVDKDNYSRAHRNGSIIKLNAFEGVYTFDESNGRVTLDTGVEVRQIIGCTWKAFQTPKAVGTL